jgi:hypothetical protein
VVAARPIDKSPEGFTWTEVRPALLAGGGFALVTAAACSPGGTVVNLALAAIQFTLAFTD